MERTSRSPLHRCIATRRSYRRSTTVGNHRALFYYLSYSVLDVDLLLASLAKLTAPIEGKADEERVIQEGFATTTSFRNLLNAYNTIDPAELESKDTLPRSDESKTDMLSSGEPQCESTKRLQEA